MNKQAPVYANSSIHVNLLPGTDLILNHPQKQTAKQRIIFNTLTFYFWIIWIYLWLPVITLILWVVGIKVADARLYGVIDGYLALKDVLPYYLITVVGIILVQWGWAAYNYIRFRGKERRKPVTNVSFMEESVLHRFNIGAVSYWKKSNRYMVNFEDDGSIKWIYVSDLSPTGYVNTEIKLDSESDDDSFNLDFTAPVKEKVRHPTYQVGIKRSRMFNALTTNNKVV